MKNNKAVFFIVTSVSLLLNMLFSQHLKVEYERTELQGYANTRMSKEFNDKMNAERKKPSKSILYYSNGYSFFKTFPKATFINDAGTKQIDESNRETKKEVFKEIELKVYHLKNEKGSYQYQNFPNLNEEFYGYIDMSYKNIAYKDDIQKIDNYYCKLVEATLNNGNVAKIWYTEDIPISTGPLGFNTFPGLVLRVELPDSVITAVKISSEASESEVEKINPKLKVYKGEEFIKKMQEIREINSKPTTEEIRL